MLQFTLRESKRIGYTYGLGRSYTISGIVLVGNGKISEGMAFYQKALAVFSRLQNHLELGKVYNNIASAYSMRGLIDEAITYYLQATAAFEQAGDKKFMQLVYNNIAVGFEKLKQYPQALQYSTKAEAIAWQIGDSATAVRTLITKSNALFALQRDDEAL